MTEIWLRPNRRAILFGSVPPLVLTLLGAWLSFAMPDQRNILLRWLGILLIVIGGAVVATLIHHLFRARIAYADGHVLFHLRSGKPYSVPVHVVESFFVGQGPATLPSSIQNGQQAVNLIARLAQRESDWARRDVKPALGRWCDGYVTISGTWCEPLDDGVLQRLNRRLHEVKQSFPHDDRPKP
jgi:prepilin-type processing-associated H-X9-DG protein